MIGFEARYSGMCAAAGDYIKVGDPIVDTDEGYAHPDCVEKLDREDRNPVCPSCWLAHAGECM